MPNYDWENVFLTVMRHVFLIEISKISQFLFGVYSDYGEVGMKMPTNWSVTIGLQMIQTT